MPNSLSRFGRTASWTLVLLAGCSLGALALQGCKHRGAKSGASPASAQSTPVSAKDMGTRRVLMDGVCDEWPSDRSILGDPDWLYFRVRVEGGTMPLQASSETLSLWLDADGDPTTGAKMPEPSAAGALGVDLVVEFSPLGESGGVTRGTRVLSYDAGGGSRKELRGSAVGVLSAPTYAASEFEVRLDRHSEQGARFARGMGERGGRVVGMFVLTDGAGKIVGWSDPERATLPAASKVRRGRATWLSEATVPAKPKGAIRVMSYNVLKGSLVGNPAPFGRVLQVVGPDVVLFQEWDTDEASAASWLSASVGGKASWNARAGKDVVIASPWPIEPAGPQNLALDATAAIAGHSPDVRFIAGVVRTPAGPVIVGSTHLKCCGTAGTSEDAKRIAETELINQTLRQLYEQTPAALRVVGGDLNLVGTRTPLDLLCKGLDANGSDLSVAPARVLGDAAFYTWQDDKTEFPPGRLDYLAFGEGGAQLINAFVLDTRRLGDRALASMGLNRADTDASDHLPVVIDLSPR